MQSRTEAGKCGVCSGDSSFVGANRSIGKPAEAVFSNMLSSKPVSRGTIKFTELAFKPSDVLAPDKAKPMILLLDVIVYIGNYI